jgi:hypothetical protein
LTMIGTYARRLRDVDYPWGPTAEEREAYLEEIERNWGGPVGIDERAPSMAKDPEFRKWWATYLRMGASPGAAKALTKMNAEIDVRGVLPSVRVPTLVVHRSGDQTLKVEEGRYVASLIPRARYVELPGNDHLPFVGDQDAIIDEVEEFLKGVRHDDEPERVLATVLFLHGDSDLVRLRPQIERELQWYRGQSLTEGGGTEGPLASFDGPARAIKCACAIHEIATRMSVSIRAGLHTGECDRLSSGKLGGYAVDIAARVLGLAQPGDVVVSSTVKDLVAGSGINFQPLEEAVGDWRLFRVAGPRA